MIRSLAGVLETRIFAATTILEDEAGRYPSIDES